MKDFSSDARFCKKAAKRSLANFNRQSHAPGVHAVCVLECPEFIIVALSKNSHQYNTPFRIKLGISKNSNGAGSLVFVIASFRDARQQGLDSPLECDSVQEERDDLLTKKLSNHACHGPPQASHALSRHKQSLNKQSFQQQSTDCVCVCALTVRTVLRPSTMSWGGGSCPTPAGRRREPSRSSWATP